MFYQISKIFQNKSISMFLLTIYNKPLKNKMIVNDMSNLGRWSLIYDKNQLDDRIRMANYDNCGISHKDNIKM